MYLGRLFALTLFSTWALSARTASFAMLLHFLSMPVWYLFVHLCPGAAQSCPACFPLRTSLWATTPSALWWTA